MRTRKWNLTINSGCECFNGLKFILQDLKLQNYYYILHDKDDDVSPHYHVVLHFENARSFEQVRKLFNGAHIEPCDSINLSVQYLIHKNHLDKFQYDFVEIVTNADLNELCSLLMLDEFEKLNTENLINAITSREVYNMTTAIMRWGINQVNTKHNLISKVLDELK